ncbi:MAG: ATP-binding protein, partial [Candidatus Cloacimonetes bacterium]|nr:ATP-binding protein [Candidatus Cloacimonadota bacterium]
AKMELLRVRFDEQARQERRRSSSIGLETPVAGALKPWREVVNPHKDVASGKYQQAEFAADLWQVHIGEGSDEYRNPAEFFRRTFLTESLKGLLVGALQRLCGIGGDPVVQLQTNFGGGKTHSMLALYHLFSGTPLSELLDVETLADEAGVKSVPKVKRVVLVGNKISPGNPSVKKDGTVVRTLWGELAWQLGGKAAFDRVAKDDELATNPGDVLRELFVEYGPCLILIDEWVAYARQLHDNNDLPAGSFETMFSFAQALTESAKLAGNCMLVVSLPASDTGTSPHAQADDAEVGGIRGREALERLRNVVGRLESSWRPATAEEGFEIVRRRLFDTIPGDQFKQRDLTARAFAELYRSQKSEFPPECAESDYEKRIKAAYPVHPEIFDRLYSDWSTLVKFQRTRGVLRLMAAVIHCLWEKGDRNPLIMPSTLPIDDPRVQSELTRYLSDNWAPIIEKDVDGPNSLPLKIDAEQSNLGKLHATRRVARTIYLGSAPLASAAHRGLEDRRVKLGCAMPGEAVAVFGDALRRLAATATYLYQDGALVWYGTQPTVTKLAEDRAQQYLRDQDRILVELEERLRRDLRNVGDFHRVHPLPRTGAEVADDYSAKLVVLPPEFSHSKENSRALEIALQILESRGNTPRLFRNTLVFLAADRVRMQDLDEALRKYLAWTSILDEKDTLNLDPHQVRQAEIQRRAADSAVSARIPEAYRWLLVPEQTKPDAELGWEILSLGGSDALAVLASKKLRSAELMLSSYGSTMLRMAMDSIPLWNENDVSVSQLAEYFARYLYLPRLAGPEVLARTIENGIALTTWSQETFAFAESFDESAGRYRGLQTGKLVRISHDSVGLLVKPDVAKRQLKSESEPGPRPPDNPPGPAGPEPGPDGPPGPVPPPIDLEPGPKRFHGTVELDSLRVGRDAGRIAEEVISHLAGIVGARVRVTLEIEADIPSGASDHLVRTVSENSRTLKFIGFGFEKE